MKTISTCVFIVLCAALTSVAQQQQRPVYKGVLSGVVRDQNDQPAQDAAVEVLRSVFTPQGRAYNSVGTGKVNDQGEFRIFSLPPGRYFVSVGTQVGASSKSTPPQQGKVTQWQTAKIAFQLYPGVLDVSQAIPVDVSETVEAHIEMRTLPAPPGYRLRGSIIDLATGQPPPGQVQMKVISKVPFGQGGSGSTPEFYDSLTGTFDIANVPPGEYVIQAQTQVTDTASTAAGEAAWAEFPTARELVTVVDKDIEKLVLTLERPGTITGRIRSESPIDFERSRVLLLPTRNEEWSPPSASVARDGTFKMFGLLKGAEYLVQVSTLDGYAKSVKYGGFDVSDKPFRYNGSDTATLEIVLGPETAQVTGLVTTALLEPVRGAFVVLIPDQRDRFDRYRRPGATNINGGFIFANVPPGDYKLFAWDSPQQNYNDPAFLAEFETLGKPLHIVGNTDITADIKVIPKR